MERECGIDQKNFQEGSSKELLLQEALSNNPEVILADEPTGNLDSKTGGQ